MKLCDRCSVPGCCLSYLGKACRDAREKYCPDIRLNNAEYITGMTMDQLATELIPIFEGLCEDGVPGEDFIRQWLASPHDEDAEEQYSDSSHMPLGNWIKRYDGWFDFFQCSLCGKKSFSPEKICPGCKARMTRIV